MSGTTQPSVADVVGAATPDDLQLTSPGTRVKPDAPTAPAGASVADVAPKDTTPATVLNTSWPSLADAGHRLALGTRDVIQGVTSPIVAAADITSAPVRAVQRWLGFQPSQSPSETVNKVLDASGLPQPQTPGEQLTSTFVRGGAAMLPAMATGIVPAGTSMVRSALPVVSGGTGAVTGREAAALPIVPPALKPTVDLLGNIVGGGGVNAVVGGADRAINAFGGNANDIMRAFDTLRIKPPTIASVSGGPVSRSAESAFSGVPPGQVVLQPKAQATVQDFSNAVDDTASHLHFNATGQPGVVPTASVAGSAVQDAIRDWRYNAQNPNSFVSQQATRFQPVDTAMSGQYVDPSGYRAALEAGARDPALNQLPETQQRFIQKQLADDLDALNADAPPGKMLTWEQAQAIRRQIGNRMGTPSFVQDMGEANLTKAYGGIAGDMQNAATGRGVGDAFTAANNYSVGGYNFINRVANKAVTTNNPAQDIPASQAADSLLRLPDESIQALRQNVPQAADALAAYNLRDMANAKPSVAARPGDTSLGTFQTNLNRMRTDSPGTYDALYNNDPYVSQRVQAMGTVGESMRRIQELANTSKTAYANYLLGLAGSATTGALTGGPAGAVAGVAAPIALPWVGGHILTNPGLIRLMGAQAGPRNVRPLLGGAVSALPGQEQQ